MMDLSVCGWMGGVGLYVDLHVHVCVFGVGEYLDLCGWEGGVYVWICVGGRVVSMCGSVWVGGWCLCVDLCGWEGGVYVWICVGGRVVSMCGSVHKVHGVLYVTCTLTSCGRGSQRTLKVTVLRLKSPSPL